MLASLADYFLTQPTRILIFSSRTTKTTQSPPWGRQKRAARTIRTTTAPSSRHDNSFGRRHDVARVRTPARPLLRILIRGIVLLVVVLVAGGRGEAGVVPWRRQ
jgi:hypothetical protein